IKGGELREHFRLCQPSLAQSPVEAGIITAQLVAPVTRPAWGFQPGLQLVWQWQVQPARHVMGMTHYGDSPPTLDYPNHLTPHPIGLDPSDHGTRHCDIKAAVWKGPRFGAPFPKLKDALQPFLPGQRHRLAEHIAVDV